MKLITDLHLEHESHGTVYTAGWYFLVIKVFYSCVYSLRRYRCYSCILFFPVPKYSLRVNLLLGKMCFSEHNLKICEMKGITMNSEIS